MLQNSYKTVEITKTVPVADNESLKIWLNKKLENWINTGGDKTGPSKSTAGSRAIDLIEEAGFTILPPVVKR